MSLGQLQNEGDLDRWMQDYLSQHGAVNAQTLAGTVGADGITPGAIAPAGSFMGTHASPAPTGFLLCDGSTVSLTTYADLYAALGTAFNTGGEPAGTFRLPTLADVATGVKWMVKT